MANVTLSTTAAMGATGAVGTPYPVCPATLTLIVYAVPSSVTDEMTGFTPREETAVIVPVPELARAVVFAMVNDVLETLVFTTYVPL